VAKAHLIIRNVNELVTCSGHTAKRGASMNDLCILHHATLIIHTGTIVYVHGTQPTGTTLSRFSKTWLALELGEKGKEGGEGVSGDDDVVVHEGPHEQVWGVVEGLLQNQGDGGRYNVVDAAGCSVLPGFVDSHTHFVFGGYRADEFFWRMSGMSYMDIMMRGGGIVASTAATQTSTEEELVNKALLLLNEMMCQGVTTVEGKSGYGLDFDTEIKQLKVMQTLDSIHAIDIVRTFCGAHALPRTYAGRSDEFVDYMINEVMPYVAANKLAEFCDIFCEKNVFSIEQSRRYLLKGQELGLPSKFHADEIVQLGGSELAAELRAVSADHLLHASDHGIEAMAKAGVVATLLPCTAFTLKEKFANARKMIDSGCAVALATDLNPGSCFSGSIPLLLSLSVLHMQMTPEEAVTALTLNGAAALQRAHTIGSLDVGKKGDAVILAYPSYKFLFYRTGINVVQRVVKSGVVVCDNRQNIAKSSH